MVKDKRKDEREEVLLNEKSDRRLLSNVRLEEINRINLDRRGQNTSFEEFGFEDFMKVKKSGTRYKVSYRVKVTVLDKGQKIKFDAEGVDISTTGMLLKVDDPQLGELIERKGDLELQFKIQPGSMPEGYEMKVKNRACFRRKEQKENGDLLYGVEFKKTLLKYIKKNKDRYLFTFSICMLFLVILFIVLLRAESIIYFQFNKTLYLYSIIAAIFLLSRYFFSIFYRTIPMDMDFTPGVTILIPCFNEEEWIQKTIINAMNQDYPIDKLEVIVIDDCSTDKSVEKIKEVVDRLHHENEFFKTRDRLKYLVQTVNKGKRDALAWGTKEAKHELVVFVDSDSFLDPFAIRNLVQPFKDPKMGGVSGRTDVANTFTNWLTKMQSVRYYIAFRVLKSAESYFDAVTCLSGPLACYRKEIILDNIDAWLGQKFFGQPATFGDDRSMTNFVLEKHRTCYQDSAICFTIVPSEINVFLKQQMRWKRSWLRESIIAGKFMWRKEPFASILFYIGVLVPILAPFIVIYNLIYVPLVNGIFPTSFLMGILMMSLLMSLAQLLLRKSKTWYYGLIFCIFYELILLWQMPIAWFTFWKATWGTRMTPEDVKAEAKRLEKFGRKQQSKKVMEK